jgi:phage terminase small subunit
MQKPLTPKQQMFVKEYLVDLNATQAAIRAGYSAKTADAQSSRLLVNVKVAEALKAAMDARAEKTDITAERVLVELGRVAFGNQRQLMTWGPDGVSFRPSSALTDDECAMVSEVSETETLNGGSLKLKTHDKIKALELIGKHLGMFKDGPADDETAPAPVKVEIVVTDARKCQQPG